MNLYKLTLIYIYFEQINLDLHLLGTNKSKINKFKFKKNNCSEIY